MVLRQCHERSQLMRESWNPAYAWRTCDDQVAKLRHDVMNAIRMEVMETSCACCA
jgi:hypothetical protein